MLPRDPLKVLINDKSIKTIQDENQLHPCLHYLTPNISVLCACN